MIFLRFNNELNPDCQYANQINWRLGIMLLNIGLRRGINSKSSQLLWQDFLGGDKLSYCIIYTRNYDKMLSYGLQIKYNKELVVDCINDLFLYLWEHKESINLPNSVEMYLLTSLRRLIIYSIGKAKKSEIRHKKYYEEHLFLKHLNIEEEIIISEEEIEKKKEIYNAISILSNKQKETVLLKYYYGFTALEIANIQGVKKQTVHNCVSESLKKMKNYFDQNKAI